MKRTIVQTRGNRKKMKAHKGVLEFRITEGDVELVAEKVYDRVAESWDDVEKQREAIMKKLVEVKGTLK
jgi:hypothetical protein